MLKDEDLFEWLICYGRTPVQDYITRSPSIRDAVQYLQVELNIEMIRSTSFVTKDLMSFEKKPNLNEDRSTSRNSK